MENRRFILIALLGVVLFFMYQAWEKDYGHKSAVPVSAAQNDQTPDDVPRATLDALPAATDVGTSNGENAASAKLVSVETDLLRIQISTVGGEITRVELKHYPQSKEHPDQALALLENSAARWFVLQSGLAGTEAPLTSPTTLYSAEQSHYELSDGVETLEVPFTYTAGTYSVRKVFTFARGSYEVGLAQTLRNAGSTDLTASPYVRFQRTSYASGDEPPFTQTFRGVGLYEQREPGTYRFRKVAFDNLAKEPVEQKQEGGWMAMLQHYFVAAIIPPAGETLTLSAKPGKDRGYIAQYVGKAAAVVPSAEQAFTTRLYIGPKLQESIGTVAPGLELTLDYGILTVLAKPLFWVLEKFHAYTGNWGVAIILLTLTVKLLLFKLSEAQYRSMAGMKKFAPKIQELKERYGDDRERMQKAMMDLYKKEGFNPLAGCWPLLVQMPIFLALYWVLLESVELRQAPFMFWIKDLAAADPYFVLPVLFGASMWFQQRLSGQNMTMDPMQQKIMNVMPIMLTAFFAFFQSGLVLYWFVSNVIGIAQQWFITRRLEREASKAPARA